MSDQRVVLARTIFYGKDDKMRQSRFMLGARGLCSVVSLGVVLLLAMNCLAWAAGGASIERYKMQSVLEYSGKNQFCNKAEALFTVHKKLFSDGRAKYDLSSDDLGLLEDRLNSSQPSSFKGLSFIVDRKTQHLSTGDKDLAMLERVTNRCVEALTKTTKENVGKTWKQTFDLASVDGCLVRELTFTLTAMPLETETYGELIAVRALSEPFFVQTVGGDGAEGTVQCRMNCAYVFGSDFEDILLSASVFAGATNVNGLSEMLKHTVTTWKVDAAGQPANFNEVGNNKDFAKLTSKLGVTESLKVVKAAPLPQWARSEGVRAAQVANLCGAVSCEGALNPVATIYLPVASTVGLQSLGKELTAGTLLTAADGEEGAEGSDAAGGGAGGGGGFRLWPPFAEGLGWNWSTAAWGAGLGVGGAAAGGAFDSDHRSYRSPIVP